MDTVVTEEGLDYISVRIRPRESRRLLRKLGLKDVTIEQVFHDFEESGSSEQLYQGLLQCKEMVGSNFTVCELVNALKIIGRTDLVEELTPGENKVRVKVTVESGGTKFEVTTSFVENDPKSIQSEILKTLEKLRNDKGGDHVQQPAGPVMHKPLK